MKKNLKLLSVGLAVLITAGSFAGCASTASDDGEKKAELTTIRLSEVTHSVFYAPQYVAINKGFFADEGLKLEVTSGEGADKVMAAVVSNQCDIGLAGPEASIYVLKEGKENHPKIFAQLTQRDGSFLVGRKDEPNFNWESLRGKTILGGRPGGVPEMTLEYTLKQKGLVPGKDVNVITNIQFSAVAGAFKSGTADYATLFEPVASAISADGSAFVVSSVGQESGLIPYTAYCASKEYIEKNKDVIQRFTNAIYKATQWVNTHSSAEVADAIIDSFPDTNRDVLIKVIDRYKGIEAWKLNLQMDEKDLLNLETIMQDAGVLEQPVDYNKLVDNSFAKAAAEK